MKSDSGSIPLFYYVRQNSEENLLINLSVISLLTPPHNSFSLTNNRSSIFIFFLLFLLFVYFNLFIYLFIYLFLIN